MRLRHVDILDDAPVLDIKPYAPAFDVWRAERTGWFDGRAGNAATFKVDELFR